MGRRGGGGGETLLRRVVRGRLLIHRRISLEAAAASGMSGASRLPTPPPPVLLAGDFNGDRDDAVYAAISRAGYRSATLDRLGREFGVTHLTFRGDAVSVDFVFFRYETTKKKSSCAPTMGAG